MSSVLTCRRCQRTNPATATYCYYDGENLRGGVESTTHQLPQAFVFPSGKRCRTYDELAQGCLENWAEARSVLQSGAFGQFLGTCGRADLARAAEEAKKQVNADIGLTEFIQALPGVRQQMPRLDLNPRRIIVGTLLVGETKSLQMTLTNQGQGMLQGTISVDQGQDWLSLSDTKITHQLEIATPKQQAVTIHIRTKGLASGQTYGAKLTVVTNGGVVEVPLRMDVAAQPFSKAPFQGVRTQRELAEKMRAQPKAAVPLLESGEVSRWFTQNGWTWPISGPDIRGIASVQQFFEALGLSKPPALQLSPTELTLRCRYPQSSIEQVTLRTSAKKWVYAQVTSDSPWLRLKTPQVSGPQHATISMEIDPKAWNGGDQAEGRLQLVANGMQKLSLKVSVEMRNLPSKRSRAAAGSGVGIIPTLVTLTLGFLLLRLCLVPVIDFTGRSGAVQSAAGQLGTAVADNSSIGAVGGWLRLPWPSILFGSGADLSSDLFSSGANGAIRTAEFRHYFVNALCRHVIFWTWWLGAIFGVIMVLRRRGSILDLLWGLLAGAFAGLLFGATLACAILLLDFGPHLIWSVLGSPGGSTLLIPLWSLVAIVSWTLQGFTLGILSYLFPPLHRFLVAPLVRGTGGLFRGVGLIRLANYWAPLASA